MMHIWLTIIVFFIYVAEIMNTCFVFKKDIILNVIEILSPVKAEQVD